MINKLVPFFWIGGNAQVTRPKFPCDLLHLELDCGRIAKI